jgi:hypothetical protein
MRGLEGLMGISVHWISVKGLSKAEVLQRLALMEVDETLSLVTEWPAFRLVDAATAELECGRVLVATCNGPLVDVALAERVSAGAELVTGFVEEHVMYSEACGYSDGRMVWRIVHNSERDPESHPNGVEVEGALPPEFEEALGEEESGFELPAAVAGLIGGFIPGYHLTGFNNVVTIAVIDGKARRAAKAAARRESGGFAGALKRVLGG